MKKKGITYKYVQELEVSELDFILQDDILGKDNYSNRIEIIKHGKGSYEGESTSIKIEMLEKILHKLKKKNCNYVEIMHHCDHVGYYFNGLKITKSTEEEISEEKNRINHNKNLSKAKEIASLEKRLTELKK